MCLVTCVTCCCSGEGAANVERRCEPKLSDHRRKTKALHPMSIALLERTTEHMHEDVFAAILLSKSGEKGEIIIVAACLLTKRASCWLLAALFACQLSSWFQLSSFNTATYFLKTK